MKISCKLKNDIVDIDIPDESINFINGYSVIECPDPDNSEFILKGIINENYEVVVDLERYYDGILFLDDNTAFVQIKCRELLNVSAFSGPQYSHWTETKHIDLTKEDPMRNGVLMILGAKYLPLSNGNILIHDHQIKNSIGVTKKHLSVIYNPKTREIVSPLAKVEDDGYTVLHPAITHIGEFVTDENGVDYAIAQIHFTAKSGNHNNTLDYHLLGKMDMEGNFISNLYNTATRGVIKLDKEGFNFEDEINRSKSYVKSLNFLSKANKLPIIKK